MGTETLDHLAIFFKTSNKLKSLKPRMGTETLKSVIIYVEFGIMIKIIKTPHGDGNPRLISGYGIFPLLKSLKPRMGTETS